MNSAAIVLGWIVMLCGGIVVLGFVLDYTLGRMCYTAENLQAARDVGRQREKNRKAREGRDGA